MRLFKLCVIILGVLILSYLLLQIFFFQLYSVPTSSMVPTLIPEDRIFVSKLTYGPRIPFTKHHLPGFSQPQRGDVVVFLPPSERNKAYIKRLIGLGGDRIVIKGGNLYINGKEAVDPRMANYYYNQGDYGQEGKEVVVPEGKYFLLGDNSIHSIDSRFWGFADTGDVIGKAVFIWWPPKRIAMIE